MSRSVVLPGWVQKRTPATALPAEPWMPAPFDDADQRALKALRDGTASAEQQQRALGWLFFASGYRSMTFRPGEDGARQSAFAEGKRHLAVQIYSMLEAAVRSSADGEQGER